MSPQAPARTSKIGLGSAILGVIFCDFFGLLLFALPAIGWVIGLAAMVIGSPYLAWLVLEDHPNRRSLTKRIAVANATVIVLSAILMIAFLAYILSTAQWG